MRKTTEPADSKSHIFQLLRLERQRARTTQQHSGELGPKKRYKNWSKAVENVITSARCRPFACMKLNCNSPSGVGTIYSEDDTRAGNIKKRLEEACGSDVKRQVVEFMQKLSLLRRAQKCRGHLQGTRMSIDGSMNISCLTSNQNVVLF